MKNIAIIVLAALTLSACGDDQEAKPSLGGDSSAMLPVPGEAGATSNTTTASSATTPADEANAEIITNAIDPSAPQGSNGQAAATPAQPATTSAMVSSGFNNKQ